MISPKAMRFTTRVMVLQLATVVAVIAVCTAVFAVLGVQQLRAQAEATALAIARSVAEDPEVRSAVAAYSADPGIPDAAALRGGPLAALATATAARTGARFVVFTDDHGIRLAHPDPQRIGEQVSTPYTDALAGRESVSWATGTLGESARAKVPIYAPKTRTPVGEASVGFERASVFDDLPALLAGIGIAAATGLALALVAGLALRRRLERTTLGVQPEELVSLVQNQTAVLDGVSDGVVATDASGVVQVCNEAAARMLQVPEPLGSTLANLGISGQLAAALSTEGPGGSLVVGDRVLYVDTRPVRRGNRELGMVSVIRDRTDIVALADRLETFRTMSGALRAQRHEFANRLHAATGLIDAGRVPDARELLSELGARGAVDYAVPGIEAITDPFVQSLIGAKAIEAAERGVAVRVSDDTLLVGRIRDAEDVASILGNLIDNAATAAVAGQQPRWVEVALLSDGDALVLSVADSGPGVSDPSVVFSRRVNTDGDVDTVHGLGVGLPLARDLARRRGGDLWIIDAGGRGTGAVFGARLEGVVDA